MINGGLTTIDDGEYEWYTVIGLVLETMHRWAESFWADTSLDAEQMAQVYAQERGIHIAVAGVVSGKINEDVDIRDAYATWTDPSAKSQEEMNMIMEELALWKLGEWKNKREEKKSWWSRV